MNDRIGSVFIEGVQPGLDAGRHAVKRVVGDRLTVRADIFKEGHDLLVAVVRWRQVAPQEQQTDWSEVPMRALGNDAWEADFPLERNGRYQYTIEAWPDLFRTWTSELKRKVDAGRDVRSELLEGAALLESATTRAKRVDAEDARLLGEAASRLRQPAGPELVAVALAPELAAVASAYPDRSLARRHETVFEVFADREKARFGAWYEFFPRSAKRDGRTHGTFKDAEAWLPYIQGMGFDVVYLPPIHPIGRTARKGRNNSLTAGPDDVGSPWAIGAAEGGHKAVHPQLGTLADFRQFVQAAQSRGIEVALDLAFQCSPDHPYVKEHPEWFQRRPDGTIKTAENPPKRYEDIVNFDWMGPAREALWTELESVVLHWVQQGVRTFRVDNPHTKPIQFWERLIRRVQDRHPDVLFLSEAFTRPKVMKALAKVGFTQSYTYFTWRNFKGELQEYLEELTRPPVSDYFRGNLWPNTPDILPELLQNAGPGAFRLRAALAATLSSVYGMYCGFELCEGRPLPGKEEYLDSEKYQLVAWDWDRAGNIRDWISRLNAARRTLPALHAYDSLRFFESDNERVLFYGKRSADGASTALVAVSLDPYTPQDALLRLPLDWLGATPDETYQVHEQMTDQRSLWQGSDLQVRLTPGQPATIWAVYRFRRTEHAFDYYE
ncbi:alpha-1,4-glucan--maltose-1-phosphate maltosyltransferase [Myxococcus sp. K15C18031901]|uniref:alpha-1,4-glucan--maltose-1-phosphate maltosyltransferase n=1 Tax=Myxococcus dinghuensis TaxID=2906761 RepID=UPI0020A7B0D4|nr:alpha-1,4-glucan--maltose-1-phosphate maltosyltransferase [Myxococcus dinghuensis]MCP3099421.1 alpha-1,4-glucan--maltose-1-phosphate maltosyltransferase [Myxococcus dinghuensis]